MGGGLEGRKEWRQERAGGGEVAVRVSQRVGCRRGRRCTGGIEQRTRAGGAAAAQPAAAMLCLQPLPSSDRQTEPGRVGVAACCLLPRAAEGNEGNGGEGAPSGARRSKRGRKGSGGGPRKKRKVRVMAGHRTTDVSKVGCSRGCQGRG